MFLVYPPGYIGTEIVGLFFITILQYVKLNNANTANKTKHTAAQQGAAVWNAAANTSETIMVKPTYAKGLFTCITPIGLLFRE